MHPFLAFSKKHSERIHVLGKPLWNHGLYTYFSYHRFIGAKATFGFSSNPDISRFFIESSYVPPMLAKNGPILDEGLYFMRDMADLLAGVYDEQTSKTFTATEKALSIDQSGAVFYIHRDTEFSEMFYFAVFPPKRGVYYEMLRSAEFLRTFIGHILDAGYDLIDAAGKAMHSIIPVQRLLSPPKELPPREIECPIKRYRIALGNKDVFLTRREFEFLLLLSQGLTLQKIAVIMGVAFRTTRSHYESLKNKLETDRKEKIIQLYTNSVYRPRL